MDLIRQSLRSLGRRGPLVSQQATLAGLLMACAPLVGCGPEEEGASEGLGTQSAELSSAPRDQSERDLGRLVRDLHGLDGQAKSIASAASLAYHKHQACQAHEQLLRLSARLQEVRGRNPHQLGAIDEAFGLVSSLLGGLAERYAASGCRSMAGFGALPRLKLHASNNRGLRGSVAFGQPSFAMERQDGRVFARVEVPGTVSEEADAIGTPALPTFTRLFAVPHGATPRLVTARARLRPELHLLVYPVQAQALEGEGYPEDDDIPEPDDPRLAAPPFTLDDAAYASGDPLPQVTCAIASAGSARGLNLAQLSCAAAQYVPASQALRLFDSVSFEIAFDAEEPNPGFLSARDLSPFEDARFAFGPAVINRDILGDFLRPGAVPHLTCPGEELLILTSSGLRPAAETLADWKAEKGIATRVQNIDGKTGEEIRSLIQAHYDECRVRLSYVLLFGDVDTIEMFPGNIPTDYPYTLADGGIDGPFGLPVLAVGRIPVETIEQADAVVNKIVAYESAPPFDFNFYQTAAFAAYFQVKDGAKFEPTDREKRPFILTSERARTALLDNGYEGERIYVRERGEDILPPARLYNGNPLPDELGPDSDFPWDASAADVMGAINDGRFLLLHRDHAGAGGWSRPSFSKNNVSNLSNGGFTPVMYSINCQSGRFDNTPDTNNFAERLLRLESGGAVAVVGASRDTSSGPNDHLALGLFDATWSNTRGDYGDETPRYRVGDILNYGREYAASQMGLGNGNTQRLFRLFHLLGDPTMEMWTALPYDIPLPPTFAPITTFPRPPLPETDPAPVLRVGYAVEGAVLTAYLRDQDGASIPIARGRVQAGQADLVGYADAELDVSALSFSASLDNSISVPIEAGKPHRPPHGPRHRPHHGNRSRPR